MENLGDILPLFCTPTWPSNHVSEKQEFGCTFFMVTTRNLSSRERQLFKYYLYFSLLQAYKHLNQIL